MAIARATFILNQHQVNEENEDFSMITPTVIGHENLCDSRLSVLENTAVLDLQFNAISGRFEWQAPDDSEKCQIEYRIDFDNGHISEYISTTNEYFVSSIYPCTHNLISVTTWIGFVGEDGDSASYIHSEPAPGKLNGCRLF